jgi:formate dehydrogenase iron-sulfur subunit
MAENAILIDTSKCIACKGCQVACKQWNELSAGTSEFFASTEGYENPSDLSFRTYNLIKFHMTVKANGEPDWLFRKKNCMHCTDAACARNCNTQGYNAVQKDPDTGFVFVDRTKCVGCQSCLNGIPELGLEGCPFGIPKYALGDDVPEDVDATKMYKCWGCLDRQRGELGLTKNADKVPACVKTCAPGAAIFGNRDAMVSKAQSRKAELEAKGKTVYLYGLDEFGGLHYIYLLLKEPSFYGLPEAGSQLANSRRTLLRMFVYKTKASLKKVAL